MTASLLGLDHDSHHMVERNEKNSKRVGGGNVLKPHLFSQ